MASPLSQGETISVVGIGEEAERPLVAKRVFWEKPVYGDQLFTGVTEVLALS